ncbi:hypothetical protein J3U16_06250 [Gilliamella sp. B3023]|uniref:hypothetical protein n=1 Tax=Gilliamella sp. B3023 TaxID=2817987 RepID=UPI00226A9BC9|nr:hypothetical protein [Gilliamella sp. B3023]MCX8674889.1 hypothetical protein [Gilliamella sp. B3023]
MDYSEFFKEILKQDESEFNFHGPVKTASLPLELSNDAIKQLFEQIRDILLEYKTIQYRNVNDEIDSYLNNYSLLPHKV